MSASSDPSIRYPPGPPPHRWYSALRTLRSLRSLLKDPIAFVGGRFAQFGDTYHVDEGGGGHLYITRDPEVANDVLVAKSADFRKRGGALDRLRPILGNGLLTSDGEVWRRQRKLMQPAFHRKMLATYADHMVRHAEQVDWADGAIIDLSSEMMRLTLRIVCRTLFDHEVEGDTDTVAHVMEALRQGATGLITPEWMPTPARNRRRRAVREMDALIDDLVATRKREGLRDDLLSLLLGVPGGMSDKQLRDELVTLFLAGHETTSHGLTWTLLLLSQNPEAEQRLVDELDAVLGGRPPTLDDLPSLPWTEAVINEALRIYPPAYALARVAERPTTVGDWELDAGAQVVVWVYHVHHHAGLHDQPEAFLPERFEAADFDKKTFLPFGRGTRMCIGARFAEMEMRLLLASLVQRYRLSRSDDSPVERSAQVTLAPKGRLDMRVRRVATVSKHQYVPMSPSALPENELPAL